MYGELYRPFAPTGAVRLDDDEGELHHISLTFLRPVEKPGATSCHVVSNVICLHCFDLLKPVLGFDTLPEVFTDSARILHPCMNHS